MDSGAARACQLSLKENTFERGSQGQQEVSANRNRDGVHERDIGKPASTDDGQTVFRLFGALRCTAPTLHHYLLFGTIKILVEQSRRR